MPIPDLARDTSSDSRDAVTRPELFFDLVFVFAITQLSRSLEENLTWMGAAEVLVMLLAVWWFWTFTTWTTNWLDPDRGTVRAMLFALMFLGLLMSTAIPAAFGSLAVPFVIGYLGMQIGRGVFVAVVTRRTNPTLSATSVRTTAWFCFSGVFWVSGVVVEDGWRLVLWVVAIAIDLLGPTLRFPIPGVRSSGGSGEVSGRHMADRTGLFVIIALGESIVTTGSGFSEEGFTVSSLTAFTGALVGSILLWLIYFAHGEKQGSDFIDEADDTPQVARQSYTYIHLVLIAGIVIVAVGDALVLAEPDGEVDLGLALTVVGGATVYLVGNLFFKRSVGTPWLGGHMIGVAATAVLFVVALLAGGIDPLALTWLVNVILAGVAISSEIRYRRQRNTVEA